MQKIFGIILLGLSLSGCFKAGQHSLYDPENEYSVGNNKLLTVPTNIKLRKSFDSKYYLPAASGLPKSVPSVLPPDSKLLEAEQIYLDEVSQPYYERLPRYPMPK